MFGAATMGGIEPAKRSAPDRGGDAAANLLTFLWYATALAAIVRLAWIFA